MKVITLTACSRTTELQQVLAALVPQLGDWKLLIGLDGSQRDVVDVLYEYAQLVDVHVVHRPEPWGIQNHQRELVRMALERGAEAVACLQDDTVPEPDAVAWLDRLLPFGFLHHPSLGLTASGGRAVWRPWIDPVGHAGPMPVGSVFCAEGFVASRKVMENLLPHWNGPSDFLDGSGARYVGWDWSLRMGLVPRERRAPDRAVRARAAGLPHPQHRPQRDERAAGRLRARQRLNRATPYPTISPTHVATMPTSQARRVAFS